MKILSLLILIAAFTFVQAEETILEAKLKSSVQCNDCKERVEAQLPEEVEIESVNVDFEEQIITVKYNPEKVELDDIKEAISDIGYDADDLKASRRAYKKLPDCCKLPEDRK